MSNLKQNVFVGLSVVAIGLAAAALVLSILALTQGEDGDEGHAPSSSDAPAYTVWLVEQALARYADEGIKAALDHYNSPETVDGAWYVFVIEEREDGLYSVANAARPELVGTTRERIDARGFDYGAAFAATTESGQWVTYTFLNPATCDEALKHSWAVRRGDLIFGAGWYEDRVAEHPLLPTKCEPAAYTVAHVEAAITRYRAEGREAALAWHSDPANNDGRWYTFIVDPAAGRIVAHPAEVFVGYDVVNGAVSFDDSGWYYMADLLRATEDGIFVRDTLLVPPADEINPFHAIEEIRQSYAVRHDGLIFISGWYSDVPTVEDEPGYTRLLVARALTMHDNEGIEAVIAHHNNPESADGERYVFVLEDREDGLYTVAHPIIPSLVGATRDRIDARGFDYGAAFIATTREGRWVQYVFPNPETGQEELKHTWIVRRGDYLIGSGWYEPVPTEDDPSGYTRLLVADAVALYAQSGLEAALDHYNAPASADGPWYVFVLEQRPDGIYTLAHPTRPARVGLSHVRIDARGVNYGLEFARTPRSGHWVDYVFSNPETGEEELKHTWIVRRGNYLFGSGWYEEVE